MLYIPITEETLSKLSQSDIDIYVATDDLSMDELAALLLLLRLTELSKANKSAESMLLRIERFLADLISISTGMKISEFQQFVANSFTAEKLAIGRSLCSGIPIYFLSAEHIQKREYLTDAGQWNWQFKEHEQSDFLSSRLLSRFSQHPSRISKEEERILNIILSERDEPIDVQGYAGTGKTWLISRLGEALNGDTTLFLAESAVQVQALTKRSPGSRGFTFAQLAEIVFSSDLIGPVLHIRRRNNRKKVVSAKKLAEYLGCYDIGQYSRSAVALKAWGVVANFCYSGDAAIQKKHVQRVFRGNEYWHQDALLTLATRLWGLICIPHNRIELPIRNYHLVKAMSLTGAGVPKQYWYSGERKICAHIIVDETHNLPIPIQQILQQSSQPVFRFGDCYQALEGLQQTHHLNPTLRKKTLSYSVRVGANVEDLYNDLLEKHPITPEAEFTGNKTKSTKVSYCKVGEIPDEYCTILTKSAWSVLLVVKKLRDNSANYTIISSAKDELKWLVRAGISFYKTGQEPSHHDFRGCHSWEDFVEKNRKGQPAILQVDQLIRAGLDFHDIDELISGANDGLDNAYTVGRVWDSRNTEYAKVMLWDDACGRPVSTKADPAKLVSHAYTGISRAKDKLYMPENMLEWFEVF